MPQEGLARSVVSEVMTGGSADELISRSGRRAVKKRILKRLQKETDIHPEAVLFTDLAVQWPPAAGWLAG